MYNNNFYKNLNKPDFTPKGSVFKFVWIILYALMGVSLFLVLTSDTGIKFWSIFVFIFQLFLNIIWSPVFFIFGKIKIALFISILLMLSVLFMIFVFYEISPLSALIQVPYFIWLCFATILNWKIIKMN